MHRLVNVTLPCALKKNLLELDVDDVAYLAEATLEVLLAGVFRQATNVNLVRLKSQKSNSESPRLE